MANSLMESPTHTESSAIPKTADHDVDEAATGTVGDMRRPDWIEGFPTELWLCIFDYLCPHCHPGPARTPGSLFWISHDVLLHKSRCHLLAITRTCRWLRDLAQRYVFHRFDSPGEETFIYFRRTMHERSDLASAVREMSVSSRFDKRSILGRLSNLRTLNYSIEPNYYDAIWADNFLDVPNVEFGVSTFVRELKELRNLRLQPSAGHLVDVPRGRLWLERLMKAAPALQSLCCHGFVDCRSIQDGQDMSVKYFLQRTFPHYAGLPENKITKLHLWHSWFRYHSLEQLLQNFKHLRDFHISHTAKAMFQLTNDDRMVRPVDGLDVVTLLEPLKEQLQALRLEFHGYPKSATGLGAFRPIQSLAGFTALRTLRLDTMSIAPPRFNCESDTTMDERFRLHKTFIENAKNFLVNMLPCTSLEFLWIDNVYNELNHPMCELARRASLGEFPKLKHVRLRGRTDADFNMDLEDAKMGERITGRYHDLERLIPEKYRARARVVPAGDHPLLETKVRKFFQEAGVRFEKLALRWNVRAEEDESARDGWVEVYPQPCVGVCVNPDCNHEQDTLWRSLEFLDGA